MALDPHGIDTFRVKLRVMNPQADRYDYGRGELGDHDALRDPVEQLASWLEGAKVAGVLEPTAMCVSTVAADGRPSGRFVLLRGLDARGLTFFTNYDSRKGTELAQNPVACATFWWAALERQVRVEGRIERVPIEESDAYFLSRPAESRLASAASPQSRVVGSRDELEAMVEALRAQHPDGPPRPEHWGGFRLVPDRFEFWQGRPARLHDRLQYDLENGEWIIRRLAP